MKTEIKKADLTAAEAGSFYTIVGTGGDPQEWVDGVEKLLAEKGIGKPVAWYQTTGLDINEHANPPQWQNAFQSDLSVLLFPLDGLAVGKLAMFKIAMQDRWFDDIVQNMRGFDQAGGEEGES